MNKEVIQTHNTKVGAITGFIVICTIALAACGRPDAAQTTGVQATAVLAAPTAEPTPEANPDATKIARLAQLNNEQASAVAAYPSTTQVAGRPIAIPTNLPTSVANKPGLGLGLTTDCNEAFPHDLTPTNCWTDVVGESYLTLYAGAMKAIPDQGVLIVYTTTLDYSTMSKPEYYNTPEKVGPITIRSVTAAQVLLATENSELLAFDIATRQWVNAAK